MTSLRVDRLIIFGSVMCLIEDLTRLACLSSILIWLSRYFLAWSRLIIAVIPYAHIGLLWRKSDHGKGWDLPRMS